MSKQSMLKFLSIAWTIGLPVALWFLLTPSKNIKELICERKEMFQAIPNHWWAIALLTTWIISVSYFVASAVPWKKAICFVKVRIERPKQNPISNLDLETERLLDSWQKIIEDDLLANRPRPEPGKIAGVLNWMKKSERQVRHRIKPEFYDLRVKPISDFIAKMNRPDPNIRECVDSLVSHLNHIKQDVKENELVR